MSVSLAKAPVVRSYVATMTYEDGSVDVRTFVNGKVAWNWLNRVFASNPSAMKATVTK